MSTLAIQLKNWKESTPPNVAQSMDKMGIKTQLPYPVYYTKTPRDQAFPGKVITVAIDGEKKKFIFLGAHIPELKECAYCLTSELGRKIFGQKKGFVGILPHSKKKIEILEIASEEEGSILLNAFLSYKADSVSEMPFQTPHNPVVVDGTTL